MLQGAEWREARSSRRFGLFDGGFFGRLPPGASRAELLDVLKRPALLRYAGAPSMSFEDVPRWMALGIFLFSAIWFFVNADRL